MIIVKYKIDSPELIKFVEKLDNMESIDEVSFFTYLSCRPIVGDYIHSKKISKNIRLSLRVSDVSHSFEETSDPILIVTLSDPLLII